MATWTLGKGRKAEMGIGTLIIFIAMIFVASIAAGVLIQTGTSLQSKALSSAKASQKSVSTKLIIHNIIAYDGSSGYVRHFEADSKLSPGSDSIDLTTSLVDVGLKNVSVNLIYSNESCQNVSSPAGNGFYTSPSTRNGTFTVEYLITASGHEDGILKRGEMVKLCFSAPYNVQEDEEVDIRFSSQYSSITSVQMVMPEVLVQERTRVYP
jgi:flagellin FlaB